MPGCCGRRRLATACAVALASCSALLAQGQPASSTPETTPDREAALWREILAIDREKPPAGAYREQSVASARRKAELLERVRAYLAAYPGGAHHDQAASLELRTLFEIATLAGGRYDDFRAQVAERLQHPLCDATRDEAAYWTLICDRLRASGSGAQPTSAPVSAGDRGLLTAYRAYVERYPESRFALRMARAIFEEALRRGDREQARAEVSRLESHWPQHPVTATLKASLRRADAVGAPFWIEFDAADGRHVDTREFAGRPLLIVVWSGAEREARVCAAEIEQMRRSRTELRVVGVNLDSSVSEMDAACGEIGVAWPQMCDERGWAGAFVMNWGVRSTPFVFAIDPSGRLAGSGGADWRRIARALLDN